MTVSSQRVTVRKFLDVAIRLRRYLQGDAEAVKGDFSHHFYNSQPITRERFDELAVLHFENTGKVSGAFEIDLDAGWLSGLRIMDGWQTFKSKMSQRRFTTPPAVPVYLAGRPVGKLVPAIWRRKIELETFCPC